MHTRLSTPRFWLHAGLLVLALALVGTTLAQTGDEWCISTEEAPMGCASITISPEGLTGDFFAAETLLAQGVNPGQVLLPPGSQRVDVKNIQSTEEKFGTLFVYEDAYANIYTTAGQIRSTTVYPRKTYIRGTLTVPCDVRGLNEGEVVACAVTIDEIPQEAPVAAGLSTDYLLDQGSHVVTITLVGDQASLFSPESNTQTFSIYNGRTSTPSFKFERKGHLIAVMSQEGILANFYLNGDLVAEQVPGIDLLVAPNKTHRVSVDTITDPAAGDIYTWRNATASAYFTAGQEKTLTLRMQQQYLKGFIEITCKITGDDTGVAQCLPTIDDVPLEPVSNGEVATYPYVPGSHVVSVDLGPLGTFRPASVSRTLYVSAGRTVSFAAALTAQPPPVTLTIVNNSGQSVCYIYIAHPDDTVWGDSLIKTWDPIEPGESRTLEISAGLWDMQADDCGTTGVSQNYQAQIVDSYTWELLPRPLPPATPIDVEVVNMTGTDICFIYMTPSDNPSWGWDWLPARMRILNGKSHTFRMTVGVYDILAQDCSSGTLNELYGVPVLADPSGKWSIILVN